MTRMTATTMIIALLGLTGITHADREEFILPQDTQTRMWRMTDDASWRDWANYHIRNCWNPDGRFVCTVRYRQYASGQDGGPYVRVIEVASGDIVRTFERARRPRGAYRHNWLFFMQRSPQGGPWHIKWWDMDRDRVIELEGQCNYLGSTDAGDKYIHASSVTLDDGTGMAGARVPIEKGGRPEPLPVGGQLEGNPSHPKTYTRISNYFEPFKPTRLFFDPDGSDLSVASTCLQQCHQSWSGGGDWYLFGNQPMKGRRWDEPFPSNQHYLSAMSCGDICRGARTDRYLVGSGSRNRIISVDLRSGGGRVVVPEALSYIHDSPNYKYSGSSAYYDNDAKGSPDGTKICFASTYDLRDGPLTHISERSSKKTGPGIHVRSTRGFPDSGRLSVRGEVIRYERKTQTTFQGLTRGLYKTGRPYLRKWSDKKLAKKTKYPDGLRPGWTVTSFDARLIPEQQIEKLDMPRRFDRDDWPDRNTPLMWQRRTDLYIAVARKPDAPWLRRRGNRIQLIPGQLHFETKGYRILRNGQQISEELLGVGEKLSLTGGAQYSTIAVEHSGLESSPSNTISLQNAATLDVLTAAPDHFSWTRERWRIDGEAGGEQKARAAQKAVREIVHRYDGVVAREWFEGGEKVRRHDIDLQGNAIRRKFYDDGRLVRREYHAADGDHITTEHFDADGFITEAIRYRHGREYEHWWYIKGTPVKTVTQRGHHTAAFEGDGTYVRQGIDWVKIK